MISCNYDIIDDQARFQPEMGSRNARAGPDSATVIRVRILRIWPESSESTIPPVTVLNCAALRLHIDSDVSHPPAPAPPPPSSYPACVLP